MADGLLPRNVAEAIKPPRATKRSIRPLTPSEARYLLTAAKGDRFEALYVVAVTAGLRQGEILGLSWDDLDLEGSVLSVRRTHAPGPGLP